MFGKSYKSLECIELEIFNFWDKIANLLQIVHISLGFRHSALAHRLTTLNLLKIFKNPRLDGFEMHEIPIYVNLWELDVGIMLIDPLETVHWSTNLSYLIITKVR